MATFYHNQPGSEIEQEVHPADPKKGWQLKELQDLVEGWIEVIPLSDGTLLVVNEEGKFNKLYTINEPVNKMAHDQDAIFAWDNIVGPAIHMTIAEMENEPDGNKH